MMLFLNQSGKYKDYFITYIMVIPYKITVGTEIVFIYEVPGQYHLLIEV